MHGLLREANAMMRILQFAAAATMLLTADSDRRALPGYQQFHFGMNEQAIRKLMELDTSQHENADIRLTAIRPSVIDGIPYELSFLMREEKLFRVNLSSKFPEDGETGCAIHFDRMFALLKSRYGDPDQLPRAKSFSGIATIQSAHFTFRDGGDITASTIFLKGCIISVVYTSGGAGKSGSTF